MYIQLCLWYECIHNIESTLILNKDVFLIPHIAASRQFIYVFETSEIILLPCCSNDNINATGFSAEVYM